MNFVLTHGFLGFGRKIGIDYFNGVKAFLTQNFGANVLVTQVDPDGSIAQRSAQLQRQLLLALGKLSPVAQAEREIYRVLAPDQKMHLIAHSMGGLDSRMMLSVNADKIAAHIASLTTISTPHRGSPVAELLVASFAGLSCKLLQRWRARQIKAVLAKKLQCPLAGLHDLTAAACEKFNQKYRDHSSVKYFSVAGEGRSASRATAKLLNLTHKYILRETGEPNDGLVSVSSARWGEFDDALWPADHADEIGHDLDHPLAPPRFNHLAAYRKIVERVLR